MIRVFVKRSVTTVMLVLFLVLMGLVAMFSLNIEEMPKIDLPMVSIEIVYPGATPLEIESEVLEIIENAVSEVSQIKKLNSQAFESVGLVRIEFNIEADADIQLLEVKDKVEAVLNDLPDEIEKPLISKIDVLAQPVLVFALISDNHTQRELNFFADDTIKPLLNSINGVSVVDVIGGDIREIRITLDPELMKQVFITITDVIDGLSRSNVNLAGGEIKQSGTAVNVKFNSEFISMDDIRNLVFTTSEGRNFTLSEIANVDDSIADRELSATYNGKDAVILILKNAPEGNAVQISADARKELPNIQKNILEPGMQLIIAKDISIYINEETISTVNNILIGMLLTIIVILIFTANISSTIITSLIIPTSLIATFFMISQAGFTINSMTLLAIASVLGTLIANGIIIIESALSKLAAGATPEDAAVEGTSDVILPVFASSGTNLAVFIPIAFMGGVAGKFFIQFGLTVVFATILSIIISFTLTPMLISKLLKSSVKRSIFERASDAFNGFILSNYYTIFKFIWRFKIIGVLLSLSVLASSLMLVKYLGVEMSPASDKDEISIEFVTPQGSTIDKTIEKLYVIDNIVRSHKEIESTIGMVGENGVTNGLLRINLIPSEIRDKSDLDLATILTEELYNIPDVEIAITRGSNVKPDMSINVYGKDYDKLIEYSKQVSKIMADANVFRSIQSSYKLPKNENRFVPDQAKLNEYGVNNAQIARAIRASIYGDDENKFKEDGDRYDINVLLTKYSRNSTDVFENIFVASPKGLLPISSLGKIEKVKATSDLMRRDRARIIEIEGTLGKSSLGKVQAMLIKELSKIDFEQGYGYYYAGDAETSNEVNAEMAKAGILALILTYMVLAAVLNSFIHPFTIALSIFTSFAGVFILMFFTDSTINIGSMLAMIMLVGLSVNNSILVVEIAISKIREGAAIRDAVWAGLESKMRTILMTSIAIILGMMPQLFSTDMLKSSMGAVLVGGMLGSIFFTLMFTPLVFYFFERIIQFVDKITKKRKEV